MMMNLPCPKNVLISFKVIKLKLLELTNPDQVQFIKELEELILKEIKHFRPSIRNLTKKQLEQLTSRESTQPIWVG